MRCSKCKSTNVVGKLRIREISGEKYFYYFFHCLDCPHHIKITEGEEDNTEKHPILKHLIFSDEEMFTGWVLINDNGLFVKYLDDIISNNLDNLYHLNYPEYSFNI